MAGWQHSAFRAGALTPINAREESGSKFTVGFRCGVAAMFKLSSMLPSFLKFFGRPQPRFDAADDDPPAMIDAFMLVADAVDKAGFDMDIALSRADPCAPIFEVEVIELAGTCATRPRPASP